MSDYLLVLLILFLGAIAFYLVYERFLNRPQESQQSQYIEAMRDLLDGRYESAFTKFRQVVAENSANTDAYLRLGQILRENNQAGRALQVHKDLTLRTGLSVAEKTAILRQLALDYLAVDDGVTAEAALKELLLLAPRNRWAHINSLKLQEKNQQWGAAYETAAQILKLEGNKSRQPLARYKYMEGEQLYKQREYHKARVVWKEALGLDPKYVQAYLMIGDSYYDEQRFEDAVTFWGKLIGAVPEQSHLVIDRLKRILFEMGRFGDIVEICENILQVNPGNVYARRTLAEFFIKKGDLDAASEVLEQVVEEHPEDYPVVLELIRLYLEKGERKKLNDLLRKLERKREKQQQPSADRTAAAVMRP